VNPVSAHAGQCSQHRPCSKKQVLASQSPLTTPSRKRPPPTIHGANAEVAVKRPAVVEVDTNVHFQGIDIGNEVPTWFNTRAKKAKTEPGTTQSYGGGLRFCIRLVVTDYDGSCKATFPELLDDRHHLEAADPLHQDTPINQNPVLNKTLLLQS
jgi:hypothetical protein